MADEEIDVRVILRGWRKYIKDTVTAAKATDELSSSFAGLERRGKKLNKSTVGDTSTVANAVRAWNKWTLKLRQTSLTMEKINVSFTFFRNIMRTLNIPIMITGLALGVQAMTALGAGTIGVTSALAPLAAHIAALPGLFVAAAQAMSVFNFAMSGIGDALGGNDEALAALSEPALEFYIVLVDLMPKVDALRDIAQRGLFPGLAAGLVAASANFGALEGVVDKTSRTLGAFFKDMGTQLGGGQWGKDIATIGGNNVTVIERFGKVFSSLANAFRDLLIVAWPILDFWTRLGVSFASWIEKSAAGGRETGKWEAFFENLATFTTILGRGLKDFGGALWDVGKAAAPLGMWILTNLVDAARELKAWTDSWTGKATMFSFFEKMKKPLEEMALLARDIFLAFLLIGSQPGIASLISTVRTDLLPVLTELAISLADAFGPALVDTLIHLAELFKHLGGELGPLTVFLVILSYAIQSLNAVLGIPGIGHAITGIFAFAAGIHALKFAIGLLAMPFVKMTAWWPKLKKGIVDAKKALIAFRTLLITSYAQLKLWAAGTRLVAGLNMIMAGTFLGLSAPIWLTILAIIVLVAALVYLYYKWDWFHKLVDKIWDWISTHWPLLAGILIGPFGLAVAAIVMYWDEISNFIMGTFGGLISWIGTAGVTLLDALLHPWRTFYQMLQFFWGLIQMGISLAIQGIMMSLGPLQSALEWVVGKIGWLLGKVDELSGGVLGKLIKYSPAGLVYQGLSGLATGTPYLNNPGSYIVGERGPEILNLPRGSEVKPNKSLGNIDPIMDLPGYINNTSKNQQPPVVVYLDGKVVAESNARHTADKTARL